MERLQKVLAASGVGSRRYCEQLITEGRVTVNGLIARIGSQVTSNDVITVDGQPVHRERQKRYVMLHKPAGVVTTAHDPQGRPTVIDLVNTLSERVYPVGRLDVQTTGLLLLTNDGELANRLMHPRYHVDKTYDVCVRGNVSSSSLLALERGVVLEDGPTAPAMVSQVRRTDGSTRFLLTIHEGRNRQVRRMCQAIGHPVTSLARIAYGPIRLDGLASGKWRCLTEAEHRLLVRIVHDR